MTAYALSGRPRRGSFPPIPDVRQTLLGSRMATIYMPLLNEGTDVWRPVPATQVSAGTYRVEGDMPDDEEWMFAPGSVVRCELRAFNDGEGLTAVGAAS